MKIIFYKAIKRKIVSSIFGKEIIAVLSEFGIIQIAVFLNCLRIYDNK